MITNWQSVLAIITTACDEALRVDHDAHVAAAEAALTGCP